MGPLARDLRLAWRGLTRTPVVGLVLREGLALAAAGAVLGLGLGAALAPLVRSFLPGVSPADPAAFLGAAGFVLAVALVACYRPARRAACVSPMAALRSE